MELGEVYYMGRSYRNELQGVYHQNTRQKQHPEQSYKSCLGVLHLTKKVGNTRLDNACKRAWTMGHIITISSNASLKWMGLSRGEHRTRNRYAQPRQHQGRSLL